MKIYTKTGDGGDTGLFGGQRVPKDEVRIEAYGTVDELNTVLGIARSFNDNAEIEGVLTAIQERLFVLGTDLASPQGSAHSPIPRIDSEDIEVLEKKIDELETRLDPLKFFILPGGSKTASFLHQARTICRRAERRIVTLRKKENVSEDALIFLNRLSDFLFVLARYANKIAGTDETLWKTR